VMIKLMHIFFSKMLNRIATVALDVIS